MTYIIFLRSFKSRTHQPLTSTEAADKRLIGKVMLLCPDADLLNPILTALSVTFEGDTWTEGTEYNYSEQILTI